MDSSSPRAPDTRSALVDAAATLFAERGFDGTSTQAIVALSDTSKGSFYHFFESKEDLYATVLEEMLERMWSMSFADVFEPEEPDDRASFWPRIVAAWRRSAAYMLGRPRDMALWRGFQESWRLIGDAGPARRLRRRALSMNVQLAERGQRLGWVRTDLTPMQCAELVEAVDVVGDAWFFQAVDTLGEAETLRRAGPRSLELIWRMLSPHEELAAGTALPIIGALADIEAPAP